MYCMPAGSTSKAYVTWARMSLFSKSDCNVDSKGIYINVSSFDTHFLFLPRPLHTRLSPKVTRTGSYKM